MAIKTYPHFRPEVLDNAPLQYAPENEAGVIYLFSHLSAKWALKVVTIRAGFPDCIATQRVGGKLKEIRIEFEYRSRNFVTHGHDPSECDWIVCWEHNWPEAPPNLKIVELRKEFNIGFNVWLLALHGPNYQRGDYEQVKFWPVRDSANKKDLILLYLTKPISAITTIMEIVSEPIKNTKGFGERGYVARMREVALLKDPLYYQELKEHQILKTASFVRKQLQTDQRLTEAWPWIRELIVRKNPSLKKTLSEFNA